MSSSRTLFQSVLLSDKTGGVAIASGLFFLSLLFSPVLSAQEDERFGRIEYEVQVRGLQGDEGPCEIILPVPSDGPHQKILKLQCSAPYDAELLEDSIYGNRYFRYFVEDPGQRIEFSFHFDFHRKEVKDGAYQKGRNGVDRALQPSERIPFDERIRQYASNAILPYSERDTTEAFYEYLLENMSYDKSGEGWGEGDALYACSAEKGNCTDFHSLFIGMCRVNDIPARFKIGYPLPVGDEMEEIPGYHCWAEFHEAGKGWVPVDISEAWKDPDRQEYYYSSLDPNRIRFTVGRDVPVKTRSAGIVQRNFFIHPLVLVDGKEHEELEHKVRFKARSEP